MIEQLFNAIRSNDTSVVLGLLDQNPDLANQRDVRGFSPLIMATYAGTEEMVKILLERGAEVNAQDANGNTALMGVAFKGKIDIAKLLVSFGADSQLRNHNGDTAYDFAIKYNQQEMAHWLSKPGVEN